jgi:putative RecB family exonuclease
MTKSQTLKLFKEGLHISWSQIFVYQSCSLRFKFQYVESRPYERISVNLPFGSSIHTALERYYRSIKDKGAIEPLSVLEELFTDCLSLELDNKAIPVIYKKQAPERTSLLNMGKAMLKAFHETIDLTGYEIVDVEVPLSAKLYSGKKEKTDYSLVGIIDLLLLDENHELIVVDNKTAAKPMAQSTADDDNQMTAYSYLLAANKFVFPMATVKCQFDLIRKLQRPKVEQVFTSRTAEDRRKFAKIASAVLAGIDAQIFMPQPSWMCGDCPYLKACKAW